MRRWLYIIPVGALASVVVIGALAFHDALQVLERPFPGFFVQENAAISPIRRSSWPAKDRGLAPGQRVISVDGKIVHTGHSFAAHLQDRAIGEPVAIGFSDGRTETFTLRSLSHGDFAATFLLPFFVGLAYLVVGGVIFSVTRNYSAALLLSICIVAAGFHMTTFDAQTSYRLARLWIAYPLLGAVALHLFAVFPERRPTFLKPLYLGANYAFVAGLISIRQAVHLSSQQSELVALTGTVYLAGAFLGCAALLLRTRRTARSLALRNKARVILWGMFATITVSLVWSFTVRFWPAFLTVEHVTMVAAFFPLLIGYAALKHDLFDMDALLRTTFTYAIVSTLVVGLYLAMVVAVGLGAAHAGLVGDEVAAAVVATLIVALLFNPLRVKVQRVVDRVFFPGHVDLREALRGVTRELAVDQTLESLARKFVSHIGRVLGARGGVLYVADSTADTFSPTAQWGEVSEELRSARPTAADGALAGAELVVPLLAGGKPIGLLALGPKRIPDVYGPAEIEVLGEIAPPVATALRNALIVRQYAARERLAALGKVAAVMIHDIKNPLGIMKVSVGTLKKRLKADSVNTELLGCMEEEVDRMNESVLQILEFARPQPVEIQQCNLQEVISRTVTRLAPQLEASGVRVSVTAAEAPTAKADAIGMERVMTNLLDNACNAMPQGGSLSVSLRGVRRNLRKAVELVIEDTGPGMDGETRDRIFHPFFTTRSGGTGLGLAIVRQILDNHQASIDVDSQRGRGTRFTIVLPAA